MTEAFERIHLWASQLDPADPLAIDMEEVLEAAAIGVRVQPRPISEAPKDGSLILGFSKGGLTVVAWRDRKKEFLDKQGWTDGSMTDHRYEIYEPLKLLAFIPLSALPVKP